MAETGRLNALEVALNNELKERQFYLKHAKRTKHPLGQLMFQRIADEELEHYERLQELHEKWVKGEKWPETVPLEVEGTNVKKILNGIIRKIDETREGDSNDLKAVRTAIDFEAKGSRYYAELSAMVADSKEKQFFNLLSTIENEHYLSLKDTEEYLTDPASWYRKMEHHSLDGG
jgi:rubrerythrin